MKILITEDDHKIATSIKKGFEQESWVCDLAFDGEEGYDLAFSESYDVIILDLMLPKMDGISISKSLRKGGIHTPILMLTAKGEIDDKVIGLNSGADDYLVKPFSFEELVARVRALVRRPVQTLNPKLETLNLIMDTKNQEVRQNNKLIQLSKKEYQLLEYLMKNKNRIVSKDNIISNVWDYESDILPNTVEVFVKYLRNKIGKDIIKTVRGFGYKIS
ncbi:MAG: response regulator transcription factor [Patescibacteria group bacterium]